MLNKVLGSDFIVSFLQKDLVTILIALFAINTTTFSLILTGIKNIQDSDKYDFKSTIDELKFSIKEQVVYIAIAIIAISIMGGSWYILSLSYIKYIFEVCLVSIFVAALSNLYDTANAVFVILDHENGSGSHR